VGQARLEEPVAAYDAANISVTDSGIGMLPRIQERIFLRLGTGQIGNEVVDRGFDGARRVEGRGFIGLKLFDVSEAGLY